MIRRRLVLSSCLAIVAVLLVLAGGALANGNARPEAAAGAAAVGSTGAGTAASIGAGPPASTARFTLEFVDADLVDVFQALATQSGVNIAMSGSVQGKTTLRLRNVTLQQALNIVTKLNGYDYAWVEAAYVVGTPEEVRAMRVADLRTSVVVLQHVPPEYAQEVLAKLTPEVTVSTQKGVRSILLLGTEPSLSKAERTLAEIDVPPLPTPPTTEMVAVRYLKAEQVAEMIKSAAPEVTVQPGPQENTLLITANSQEWEVVRSLVSASDVLPSAAQASQALYYVKYTSPQELQETLASLLPDLKVTLAPRSFTPVVQTAGTGGGTMSLAAPQYGDSASGGGAGALGTQVEAAPVVALILSGAPWTVERGLEVLAELDKAPRMVHIAAMITEVSQDDVLQLGIDWGGTADVPGLDGVPVALGELVPDGVDAGQPTREMRFGTLRRSYLQWSASIRMLEEQGRAKILSNPSVTTLDGRQTSLHTGETYYYTVQVGAVSTVGFVTDTRTFDVGVNLTVNPRINENDEITLTIAPVIAALKGISDFQLPVVTERAIVTTVRVKSGETVAIGGLISEIEQTIVRKVPLLGDIPIIGELFKSREERPSRTEIVIFVTPTIIEA